MPNRWALRSVRDGPAVAAATLFVAVWVVAASPARAQNQTCTPVMARVVSLQGSVELRSSGKTAWVPVKRLDTPVCRGDLLRTGPNSRALLFIPSENLLRVDQNTTVSVHVEQDETVVEFFIDEKTRTNACGAGYAISRFPRKFKINTPFSYAAVEGTEFLVALSCTEASVSVFEGKVSVEQRAEQASRVLLGPGQTTSVGPGQPPVVQVLVKPIDAVQWALFYPPLADPQFGADPLHAPCESFAGEKRAACLLERAEAQVRAGQVNEAQADIGDLLALQPGNGDAFALRAVISVVRNEKTEALRSAQEATRLSPDAFRPWLALSYAQQASFDLEQALESARKAAALAPTSALAQARVAELLVSLGRIRDAEKVARQAVAADPKQSRGYVVLGFVQLAEIDTKSARQSFNQAIDLDSSDPLPRLGMGLAMIRDGHLAKGRDQIEIAVALDPTNSLIRSYVGRAYFEERTTPRLKLALEQFGLAEQLDPYDPTPVFYRAIALETENRRIEAVSDMQESVRRNDNRAVYRSETALNRDAASRSVGLARMYTELGFEESAQQWVATALAQDPSSYAAQQYLSDIAAVQGRQQFTRASAGLQAQLRQPLGTDAPLVGTTGANSLVPDRPFLSMQSIGPRQPGLYDFDPLFFGSGVRAHARGLAGSFDTAALGASASGTFDKASITAGAFHAETDGQRVNNDQSRTTYAALLTLQPIAPLRLQADFQQSEAFFGDLPIRWDPNNVARNDSNVERFTTGRVGLWGQLSWDSELLLAFTYAESKGQLTNNDPTFPYSIRIDGRFTSSEAQYVRTTNHVTVVAGASSIEGTRDNLYNFAGFPIPQFEQSDREQTAYVYATITPFDQRLKFVVGGAWDNAQLNSVLVDQERTYPKLGVLWRPVESITVRAAYFSMIQRPLPAGQTLEPVQVAGFSQMYDDPYGTVSDQVAGAVDIRLGQRLYLGASAVSRQMDIPYFPSNVTVPWSEDQVAGYVRWLPTKAIALSLQAISEDFERTQQNQGTGAFLSLRQLRVPATFQWFRPSGITAVFRVSYLHQNGVFCAALTPTCDLPGTEESTVADIGLSYRLPRRAGTISLDVLNVFDKQFRYQSVDTSTLVPFTGRAVFARISLAL